MERFGSQEEYEQSERDREEYKAEMEAKESAGAEAQAMTEIVETKEGLLREKVQEVYVRRKHFLNLDYLVGEARKEWEMKNKTLIEECEQALEEKEKAEEQLRDSAVAFYNETKNKKPVPGVEVKLYQVLNYSEGMALNWALDKKLPACLKLDKKMFEQIAPALRPDFVEIKEEARCTIATDLAKALNQEKGELND